MARAFAFAKVYRSRTHRPDWLKRKEVAQFFNSGWLTFLLTFTLPTDAKPITTWRNRDAAFTDVAAGIRRVIEDLSSLGASAPRAALPPVGNVPYPRNAFFIGREALLAQLRQHLQTGQA